MKIRRFISVYVFSLLVLTGKPVLADEQAGATLEAERQAAIRQAHFNTIDELVLLRAPGLALKYLQQRQPAHNPESPTAWLHWEQKHILLLKHMGYWSELIKRVDQQKEKLSSHKVATADRNWFLTQQLHGLIKTKQYQQCLNQARLLLWNASPLVRTETLAAWRRIIIQVYLNQAKVIDAQIAMRRYLQDYGELQNEDGVSWLQLRAELLIQQKQFIEAIQLLKPIETAEARALLLLASLNGKQLSAAEVLDSAQLLTMDNQLKPQEKILFQYVALVAAKISAEADQAMSLLESLLISNDAILSDSIEQIGGVEVNADSLWDYYLKKGNLIANQQGLLKGDDESWFTLASNYFQTEPMTSKALFAVLSLNAQQLHQRQLSMLQLVKLTELSDQSLHLVNRLFTESQYFKNLEQVPAEVRYRLIDFNISLGKIKSAAILMANLKQPPKDQPQFDWNLRRARVLVLSGDIAQGSVVLKEMLSVEKLEPGQADRYLQVVFDLQAIEQYALSLELFASLEKLVEEPKILRELNFWKAESYHGLKQYDQAAYLFLKSAISPEKVYDPWYHTSTFRAAESLMAAGLYEDARQRFLHLLKITQNAARKSVIRQRLQAIQLKQQVN